MTSAVTTRPAAWRGLLAGLVCAAGLVGFVVAGWIALIVWTGCFIGCTGTDHDGGALIGLLAAGSLASGPAAVSGLYRSAAWMRGAGWTFGAGLVVVLVVLVSA